MSEPTKRRRAHGALAALAAGSLLIAGLAAAAPATAAPPTKAKAEKGDKTSKHDFRTPLQEKQDAMRQKAIQDKLAGKATGQVQSEVAKGQFVQLEREGTDRIFVVFVEFGDTRTVSPVPRRRRPAGSTR